MASNSANSNAIKESSNRAVPSLDLGSVNVVSLDHHERAYLGRSGFMAIFDCGDSTQGTPTNPLHEGISDAKTFALPTILRESFVETYQEYCYNWCPVLERNDIFDNQPFAQSVLMQQALGVLGTKIKPLVINHISASTYYDRARMLFYGNKEHNPFIRIVSIVLLHWWSAGPPNVVSLDSQYWWVSVAIRLAQEIGLHREPTGTDTLRPGETLGLRRRVWWTLFVCAHLDFSKKLLIAH